MHWLFLMEPCMALLKEKNVKLRKEIAIAIKECMLHEGIFGVLVSHGSSTVPRYIVDEIKCSGVEISRMPMEFLLMN